MTKGEYEKIQKSLNKGKSKGLSRLLNILWDYERLTAKQIREEIGIEHVAEGVRKLRHDYGVPIDTRYVTGTNRYGEPVRYGEYSIQRRR